VEHVVLKESHFGRSSLLGSVSDNSNPRSLATAMRRKRFAFFLSLLDAVPRPVRILDVGGVQQFWKMMGTDRLDGISVTLLNLRSEHLTDTLFVDSIAGDARDLRQFESGAFDVVFSNSVIEHLGPRFEDQRRMADEVRRVGKRYFVQTPNRYFPVEPHFLTPGFQFLPVAVRVWLVTHFSVGWYPRFHDMAEAEREVRSISLLSRSQVRELFPEARLFEEKIFGLTKSFVAFHGWEEAKAKQQQAVASATRTSVLSKRGP
jgi:SAM-dependent methyltransferase